MLKSYVPDPPVLISAASLLIIKAFFFSRKHRGPTDFRDYISIVGRSIIVISLGYAWLNEAFNKTITTGSGVLGAYSPYIFLGIALVNDLGVNRFVKRHVVIETGRVATIHLVTTIAYSGIYIVLLIAETVFLKLVSLAASYF